MKDNGKTPSVIFLRDQTIIDLPPGRKTILINIIENGMSIHPMKRRGDVFTDLKHLKEFGEII